MPFPFTWNFLETLPFFVKTNLHLPENFSFLVLLLTCYLWKGISYTSSLAKHNKTTTTTLYPPQRDSKIAVQDRTGRGQKRSGNIPKQGKRKKHKNPDILRLTTTSGDSIGTTSSIHPQSHRSQISLFFLLPSINYIKDIQVFFFPLLLCLCLLAVRWSWASLRASIMCYFFALYLFL